MTALRPGDRVNVTMTNATIQSVALGTVTLRLLSGTLLPLLDDELGVTITPVSGRPSPDAAAQGGPPPARPVTVSPPAGDRPGYTAESWMPTGHIVDPPPHPDPAVIEYPGMLSGAYSYTALAGRTR